LKDTFYSNGKLLLTAEYAVLDGAKAIALPTRFGQSLTIAKKDAPGITWKSYDEQNLVWFEGTYDIAMDGLKSNSDDWMNMTLGNILHTARIINPNFLLDNSGLEIKSAIDFPRNWGLGTSSTLINNIAQWAQVDPYALLEKSFGGSGYDIAAAQNDSPIVYQKTTEGPFVTSCELPSVICDNSFFVYLNKKQNSREGIKRYRELANNKKEVIKAINIITDKILSCESVVQFSNLIMEHEAIISELIEMTPIKEGLFADYPYAIKSLGAWGGDFIIAVGEVKDHHYFKNKGYSTILPYAEMIK